MYILAALCGILLDLFLLGLGLSLVGAYELPSHLRDGDFAAILIASAIAVTFIVYTSFRASALYKDYWETIGGWSNAVTELDTLGNKLIDRSKSLVGKNDEASDKLLEILIPLWRLFPASVHMGHVKQLTPVQIARVVQLGDIKPNSTIGWENSVYTRWSEHEVFKQSLSSPEASPPPAA